MSIRAQLIAIGACALVVGGSLLALRWAMDSAADLGSASAPEEAGRELDPADVEWLSYAPDRTVVDPAALRTRFGRLRDQLDTVFAGEAEDRPSPRIDRSFVDSVPVTVLVGVDQHVALPEPTDRCLYLREIADRLAALGWTLSVSETAGIQTEYPLVSPGPQNLELSGESRLGNTSLYAPAAGGYAVTYGVAREHLDADDAVLSATDPPEIPCD